MFTATLLKTLKGRGLHPNDIEQIITEFTKSAARTQANKRSHNWDYVLSPLSQVIKGLQTNGKRWRADPKKATLYEKYLKLLLTTRGTIQNVRALNVHNKSIAELHAAHGESCLPGNGMCWPDWVPSPLQDKVRLSFAKMYAGAGGEPPAMGKRLIPFACSTQVSANERRWSILHDTVLSLRNAHITVPNARETEEESQQLLDDYDKALKVIHKHNRWKTAPVRWGDLLKGAPRSDAGETVLPKTTGE